MDKKQDKFEFIRVVVRYFVSKYDSGELPIYLMASVLVYNIIFFAIFPKYGFYTLFPLVLFAIAYFLKPWSQQNIKLMRTGYFILFIDLLFDFFISVSYIIDADGYGLLSIPTLIIDVLGMLSILYWWTYRSEKKININRENDNRDSIKLVKQDFPLQ